MKILHGCGHSFHHECFPCGQDICCVCKEELLDAIKSLSETASEAILNPEPNKATVQQDEEDDGEDDSDDDGETSEPPASGSINDACMQLQREICSWGLIPGPKT